MSNTLHLPPQELVKKLRFENMQLQHTINALLGVDNLRREVVELCVFLAYKNGGTVTITPEDLKAVDKCTVHKSTDKETGARTYSIELRKEQGPCDSSNSAIDKELQASKIELLKKKEPILKAVK